ncbi:MAG: class I SAM-dependent methyltransferase [Planctomycetales bacterium]
MPQGLSIHCPTPSDDERACCLCGGEDFQRLHEWKPREGWNPASIPIAVWKCSCELVLLHPVPAPEQMPDDGDWWSRQRKSKRRSPRMKRFREWLQRLLFKAPPHRFIDQTKKAVPAGKMLDIGCGRGALMKYASRYYDCVGLDPSPAAAAAVAEKGLPIIQDTIENADLEDASYDVVTMDSVIEHVLDPVETLEKIHRILKPGGVVAMKTPKFDGPAYRRHGAEWNGFRHGYHTYLFTGDTLGRARVAAGFEVLDNPKRDRLWDDVLILWGRKPSDEPVVSIPFDNRRAG